MPEAEYVVLGMPQRGEPVYIRDIGPWDRHPTITNDADGVVKRLKRGGMIVPGQRLLYYDSEGHLDEIVLDKYGEFQCFAPGPKGGVE